MYSGVLGRRGFTAEISHGESDQLLRFPFEYRQPSRQSAGNKNKNGNFPLISGAE